MYEIPAGQVKLESEDTTSVRAWRFIRSELCKAFKSWVDK